MSGRLALLCTLLVGGRLASADEAIPEAGATDQKVRRPVAVIELSETLDAQELAALLVGALNVSDELRPLDRSPWQAALTDEVSDEIAKSFDQARQKKETAENLVSDFKFGEALQSANQGLEILKSLVPTPPIVALYAQLTFALGAAKLGDRKGKEADLEFRLAHSIDPTFKPDGVRYLPDFLQAYDAAIKVPQPKAKIAITGTGRVFLDGRNTGEEVHESRQTLDVQSGKHVVWLMLPT